VHYYRHSRVSLQHHVIPRNHHGAHVSGKEGHKGQCLRRATAILRQAHDNVGKIVVAGQVSGIGRQVGEPPAKTAQELREKDAKDERVVAPPNSHVSDVQTRNDEGKRVEGGQQIVPIAVVAQDIVQRCCQHETGVDNTIWVDCGITYIGGEASGSLVGSKNDSKKVS